MFHVKLAKQIGCQGYIVTFRRRSLNFPAYSGPKQSRLAWRSDQLRLLGTLRLARHLGYTPIVPPNPNRLNPAELDRVAYRRRNEIERLFRRLKGYRRIFRRFDKLDALFLGFINLALIVEALRFSVNTH
jgi:transposase